MKTIEDGFELAGARLDWPIGSAAGMTNHPDIEVVKRRVEELASIGLPEVVVGSWKLGEPHGGNAHVQQADGSWTHEGGDEYSDVENGIGHNAKGLPGPGTRIGMYHLSSIVNIGRRADTEISLSLSPHTTEPLSEMPELLDHAERAFEVGVLRVELNLSCPNLPERPPFYLDSESVLEFVQQVVANSDRFRNRYGEPGLYPKFGPMGGSPENADLRRTLWEAGRYGNFGGFVTSNTVMGDGHIREDGTNAITVNNGKAGRSGPFYRDVGHEQSRRWLHDRVGEYDGALVSALGITDGHEVHRRITEGAALCQLGSALYWPQFADRESAKDVVSKIKSEFIEASTA